MGFLMGPDCSCCGTSCTFPNPSGIVDCCPYAAGGDLTKTKIFFTFDGRGPSATTPAGVNCNIVSNIRLYYSGTYYDSETGMTLYKFIGDTSVTAPLDDTQAIVYLGDRELFTGNLGGTKYIRYAYIVEVYSISTGIRTGIWRLNSGKTSYTANHVCNACPGPLISPSRSSWSITYGPAEDGTYCDYYGSPFPGLNYNNYTSYTPKVTCSGIADWSAPGLGIYAPWSFNTNWSVANGTFTLSYYSGSLNEFSGGTIIYRSSAIPVTFDSNPSPVFFGGAYSYPCVNDYYWWLYIKNCCYIGYPTGSQVYAQFWNLGNNICRSSPASVSTAYCAGNSQIPNAAGESVNCATSTLLNNYSSTGTCFDGTVTVGE